MYDSSSETKELRRMYNFNSAEDRSSDAREASNNFSSGNFNYLEEMDIHSEAEENAKGEQKNDEYSNNETTGEALEVNSTLPPNNSSLSNQVLSSNIFFSDQKTPDSAENSIRGNAGHKKVDVKHILGLDKKSTKGMTPAEKEQFNLEERWKNAMLEEERLNALDIRVSHSEETMRKLNLTPNFPPNILCIKPLVHHDINTIPEARKGYVKLCFVNWLITCALLIVNMIVAIAVGFIPRREDGSSQEFNQILNTILAVVYVGGGPLGFIVWYWQIYTSCSTGRNTRHILSLCGLLVAIGFSIYALIGHTSYGVCGIELAIHVYATRNRFAVIPVLIVLLFWLSEVSLLCYCLFRQFMFYRRDVKAQQNARSINDIQNIIGV